MNDLEFRNYATKIRISMSARDRYKKTDEEQLTGKILDLAYTNPQLLVGEFHQATGLPITSDLTIFEDKKTTDLRLSLFKEEFQELMDGWEAKDRTEIFDAMLDLIYVIYGAAISLGFNLPTGLAEVHRSNMTKLGPDGKPIVREDGKILKPNTWQPPLLQEILHNNIQAIDYKEPFER